MDKLAWRFRITHSHQPRKTWHTITHLFYHWSCCRVSSKSRRRWRPSFCKMLANLAKTHTQTQQPVTLTLTWPPKLCRFRSTNVGPVCFFSSVVIDDPINCHKKCFSVGMTSKNCAQTDVSCQLAANVTQRRIERVPKTPNVFFF